MPLSGLSRIRQFQPPRWLLTSLKLAISVILIVLLARQVDLASIASSLTPRVLPAILLCSAILMVQSFTIGWRWRALLHTLGTEVPLGWALRYAFVGTFFNQCLPSSIGGDGFRIVAARRRGMAWQNAMSCVLVERYSGVVCILLIAAIGIVPLTLALTSKALTGLLFTLVLAGILGTLMVAALAEIAAFRRMPSMIGRLLNWWIVGRILTDMRRVVRSRQLLATLLITGLIGNFSNALTVWIIGQSIGVPLGIGPYLTIMSLAVLATVLPLSLAGWGVRDGVVVLLLGAVGVSRPDALVISIGYGVALLLSSLPGGVLLWWPRHEVIPAPEPDNPEPGTPSTTDPDTP